MKVKLLTKLTSVAALSFVITACGEGPDYGDAEAYKNAQPVTVDGDLNLTVNEENMVEIIDLFQGVTNPSETTLYARDFQFIAELVDENEVATPNYEGPMLPFTAVSRTGNELFIDTDTWKELLVHPATVAERDALDVNNDDDPSNDTAELYSQGVYRFTYLLDNGADEIVERNITLTVNAVEDKVSEIEINHADGFSIAKDYTVQLSTTVLPLNATFPQLTYASSDESVATIDANGVITGVEFGDVTFTITSADGEVVETISGVVEELSAPIGVGIKLNGEDVSEITLPVEATRQLTSELLPTGYGFTEEVMWSVSPEGVVAIDEMTGEITGLVYDSENPDNNVVTVTAYVVNDPDTKGVLTVTTGPSSNLLFNANADFETGSAAPWAHYWETPEGAGAIAVTAEAAKDGQFGLHFVSDGTKHAGLTLPPAKVPQDLGAGQGRQFKLSYDIKLNNYDGNAHPMRFYFVAQGAWPQRIEKWHNPINSTEWTHVEVIMDEADLTGVEDDGRIDLYFIGGKGAVDAYFDNISLELVE